MRTYQLGPNLYHDPSPEAVEVILRKKGFLLPEPPDHDPGTQKVEWVKDTTAWAVLPLPEEHVKAKAERAEVEELRVPVLETLKRFEDGSASEKDRNTALLYLLRKSGLSGG